MSAPKKRVLARAAGLISAATMLSRLFGLIREQLFAALMGASYLRARALPAEEALLARGIVVAFAVGCLFNDFLLDSTEGHIWAVAAGALFGASRRLGLGGR